MNAVRKNILLILVVAVMIITSCQQPGPDSTGSEFMPDMAHSVAYESNYYNYYYNNTWGTKDDYHQFAQPKLPVKGTIPRGYAGEVLADNDSRYGNAISVPMNGSVPYYYGDTEEERTRATEEIIQNPYPITEAGLAKGEELYDIFCGICHGDKGDGAGYLVREDGGVYPVLPANLINDEFTSASNGRFYHAIMYGKNLMGAYKDKMNFEERWQVIHYIRSLQARDRKLEYTQYINTLNDIEQPAGDLEVQEADMIEGLTEMLPEGEHQSDENHTQDH